MRIQEAVLRPRLLSTYIIYLYLKMGTKYRKYESLAES